MAGILSSRTLSRCPRWAPRGVKRVLVLAETEDLRWPTGSVYLWPGHLARVHPEPVQSLPGASGRVGFPPASCSLATGSAPTGEGAPAGQVPGQRQAHGAEEKDAGVLQVQVQRRRSAVTVARA